MKQMFCHRAYEHLSYDFIVIEHMFDIEMGVATSLTYSYVGTTPGGHFTKISNPA
jgi:hypothetical protein